MNYNNPIPEKTAGIVRYSCGFLFDAFCFAYLYFLQGEVLAEVQHALSHGLTHYSLLPGAVIITVILQMLQWVVRLFVRMPNRYYALTYMPSFLALAMLSDINRNLGGNLLWEAWVWLMPLLLLLWILLSFVTKTIEKSVDNNQASLQSLLWPNYLIMLLMTIATGSSSTVPSVMQYEMKVERLILQKRYAEAANVGLTSLETSQRLNRMRSYALAKEGELGERLFTYPQLYGTYGLIDIKDTISSHRFSKLSIELMLGAIAGNTIANSGRYLERIESDSLITETGRQYALCYMLLDKDLDAFNREITLVYGDTIAHELPRAYQEAIVLQHPEYTPDSLPIYINKVYVEEFDAYLTMKSEIKNESERKNQTRRRFGDTFWWYYDN